MNCCSATPSGRLAAVAAALALALAPAADAATWPTWGNDSLATCTFAAAANWETLALHYTPSEADVIRQFHEAGGSDLDGIDWERFEAWWSRHGIGGVHVHLREVATELNARQLHGVLARGYFPIIWQSDHAEVVIRTDRTGPVLVSLGEEEQMTWQYWHEYVLGIYVPAVTGQA